MKKARTKTKAATAEAPATEAPEAEPTFNPSEFDTSQQNPATPIVHDLAEHTRLHDAAEREAAHESGHGTHHGHSARHREHASGHIANPSGKRRESHAASVRKLPGTLSITAGDLLVEMIDAGDNRKGIGIRVKVPEGRTLSDEEKNLIRLHVKGENGEQTGFSWDRDNQMWHKQIVRPGEHPDDVPRTRPVAIRLDAERRVEALADALKQHQADPVGFAEAVKQRREQAAESGRIPN